MKRIIACILVLLLCFASVCIAEEEQEIWEAQFIDADNEKDMDYYISSPDGRLSFTMTLFKEVLFNEYMLLADDLIYDVDASDFGNALLFDKSWVSRVVDSYGYDEMRLFFQMDGDLKSITVIDIGSDTWYWSWFESTPIEDYSEEFIEQFIDAISDEWYENDISMIQDNKLYISSLVHKKKRG